MGGREDGVDSIGVAMLEWSRSGFPNCFINGSWMSFRGHSRTEGLRVLLPRRSGPGSVSSAAHEAKGRACRARRQALLVA